METAAAVEKTGKFLHRSLQNACWRFAQFPQARRRLTKTTKQQNRTDHLLRKPDIFICYRHERKENIGIRKSCRTGNLKSRNRTIPAFQIRNQKAQTGRSEEKRKRRFPSTVLSSLSFLISGLVRQEKLVPSHKLKGACP